MNPASERWPSADRAVEHSEPPRDPDDEDDRDDIVQLWCRVEQRERINDFCEELPIAEGDQATRQRDILDKMIDVFEKHIEQERERHREPTYDPAAISGEGVSGGSP